MRSGPLHANARQQIAPVLLSRGADVNPILLALRQEAGQRAASAQRGQALASVLTALGLPTATTARTRGKFTTLPNALVSGKQ
jgi:hypothetical protein